VGANTGQHAMFLSKFVKAVYAFEPYPPVLVRLNRHVSINEIKNITVFPVGLGSANEEVPFFEPEGHNMGTGSFVKGSFFRNSSEPTLSLKIVVGDDVLQEAGVDKV